MTDRINTITIVLDKDYRNDDAESIINAIRQIKGVLSASANVSDGIAWMAEERAREDLRAKIIDILWPSRS